jgi:hypothetical protein
MNQIPINEIKSIGPLSSVGRDHYLFDTRPRAVPLWLGYNASPLFGATQFQETWTGQWSAEVANVFRAYKRLYEKTQDSFGDAFPNPGKFDDDAWRRKLGRAPWNPGGLFYHYICLSVLDQFADQHRSIADSISREFNDIASQYGELIANPRLNLPRLEFGFALRGGFEAVERFRNVAFRAGILCSGEFANEQFSSESVDELQPQAETTSHRDRLLFQLNLAYRNNILALFWRRFHKLMRAFIDHSEPTMAFPGPSELGQETDHEVLYDFHRRLLELKLRRRLPGVGEAKRFLADRLAGFGQTLVPAVLDGANYSSFRAQILQIQAEVYEPTRRTPAEEFDMLFDSPNPTALVLLDGVQIAAMAFAGRLSLFTQERGVASDPFVNDRNTYYSVDLTIAEPFRGGLGMILKQALVLLAMEHGVTAIHGRNRDHFARGMWAINLSMGSYELQRLQNDYPDELPHRDCIYYRCPLQWGGWLADRLQNVPTTDVEKHLQEIMASLPNVIHGRPPSAPLIDHRVQHSNK